MNRILLMNEVLPTNVRFTLAKECHRNLSDIRHSAFKIGVVNRWPILFRTSSEPLRTLTPHPPLSQLPHPFRFLFSWAPVPLSPDELLVFLFSKFSILLLLPLRCSRPGWDVNIFSLQCSNENRPTRWHASSRMLHASGWSGQVEL